MGSNAGGFSFDLVKRNAMLEAKGVKPPAAWKTGTTIAGVVFKVCQLQREGARTCRHTCMLACIGLNIEG